MLSDDGLAVTDDRGQTYDPRHDSVAYIILAMQRSVRRWRFARTCYNHHCLRKHIVINFTTSGDLMVLLNQNVVDAAKVLAKVLRGTSRWSGTLFADRLGAWSHEHATALTSAFSHGQWTQHMHRMVGHSTDDRCQLCMQEVGTFEHRDQWTVTKPPAWEGQVPLPAGWPDFSQWAGAYWAKLGKEQKQLLRTHGLGVVTARRAKCTETGTITRSGVAATCGLVHRRFCT